MTENEKLLYFNWSIDILEHNLNLFQNVKQETVKDIQEYNRILEYGKGLLNDAKFLTSRKYFVQPIQNELDYISELIEDKIKSYNNVYSFYI